MLVVPGVKEIIAFFLHSQLMANLLHTGVGHMFDTVLSRLFPFCRSSIKSASRFSRRDACSVLSIAFYGFPKRCRGQLGLYGMAIGTHISDECIGQMDGWI